MKALKVHRVQDNHFLIHREGEDPKTTGSIAVTWKRADADLLAAAPDLLAALERVGCQDGGGCGPNEPDGRCFVCAAIAKAEGKQS